MFFIPKLSVPKDKRVTHASLACSIRPQKVKTHRVQMTAVGKLTCYPGQTSTPLSDITTIKPIGTQ